MAATHGTNGAIATGEAAARRPTRRGRRGGGSADEESGFDLAEFSRQVRRLPELAEALDRMWPRLSAEELLHDLFGSPALLALAAKGVLTPAEQAPAASGPAAASLADIPWTVADLALIDEARVLLGPRAGPGPAGAADHDDGPRTYGHIVVDEAQDLSPMQLRIGGAALAVGVHHRGGRHRPGHRALGPRQLGRGHRPPARASARPALVELTVSYRTPAEVVEVAARVLAETAPGLRPPTPVRRTGVAPAFEQVEPARSWPSGWRRWPRQLPPTSPPAPPPCWHRRRWWPTWPWRSTPAGVAATDPRRDGLGAPLSLLPVDLANGLEFDAVVVVEPAAIVEESPQGLRALYVALTRPDPTPGRRPHRPLPAALRA